MSKIKKQLRADIEDASSLSRKLLETEIKVKNILIKEFLKNTHNRVKLFTFNLGYMARILDEYGHTYDISINPRVVNKEGKNSTVLHNLCEILMQLNNNNYVLAQGVLEIIKSVLNNGGSVDELNAEDTDVLTHTILMCTNTELAEVKKDLISLLVEKFGDADIDVNEYIESFTQAIEVAIDEHSNLYKNLKKYKQFAQIKDEEYFENISSAAEELKCIGQKIEYMEYAVTRFEKFQKTNTKSFRDTDEQHKYQSQFYQRAN
ncbi:MAG: hypothetical protein J0H68_03275 [Sphingobacteriia bacterium]|nr:hypothetical protein [Sphingobacteriia bacterium]